MARPGDRCDECLVRLVGSTDPTVRLSLAGDVDLTPSVLSALASDDNAAVRLIVAGRPETPLLDLQRLEQDSDDEVGMAAGRTLSAALTPRVFDASNAQTLFTADELVALAGPDGDGAASSHDSLPPGFPADRGLWTDRSVPTDPSSPAARRSGVVDDAASPSAQVPTVPAVRLLPVAGGADRRPRHLAAHAGPSGGTHVEDFDDLIERLESLGHRLSTLESALSATGNQLASITRHLSELAGDPSDIDPGEPLQPTRVRRVRPSGVDPGRSAAQR